MVNFVSVGVNLKVELLVVYFSFNIIFSIEVLKFPFLTLINSFNQDKKFIISYIIPSVQMKQLKSIEKDYYIDKSIQINFYFCILSEEIFSSDENFSFKISFCIYLVLTNYEIELNKYRIMSSN